MGRIVAGRLASRQVRTLPGRRLRPTTDRVREAVFALLAARLGMADQSAATQLSGRVFLDLYAGSGAVGLEAVSRGAGATWVEQDAAAARLIGANARSLGVTPDIVTAPVERWLAAPARQVYDIVWLDPPYDRSTAEIAGVIGLIDGFGWLRPGGLILVERSARSAPLEFPESILDNGTRRYGETVVHLGEKAAK